MAEDQKDDGLRYFRIDWEKELNKRFPEGIKPVETPFMKLMGEKSKAKNG